MERKYQTPKKATVVVGQVQSAIVAGVEGTHWFAEWEEQDRELKLAYWRQAEAWVNEKPLRQQLVKSLGEAAGKTMIHRLAASFWSDEHWTYVPDPPPAPVVRVRAPKKDELW